HQAGVWRYLRVLGCTPAEADDLTQETFLAVLQRPFEEVAPAATAAYLRRAARSLFLTAKRRSARWVALEELDQLESQWVQWAGDDAGESLLTALGRCLGTLADKARRGVDLRYREGRRRSERAAALGMSEAGANTLLQRAKHH